MDKIINISKILEIDKTWQPNHIVNIINLELSIGTLKITFNSQNRKYCNPWPDAKGEFIKITLLFQGVDSFCFTPSSTQYRISGFDIINIPDKGWQDRNFEIEDYEAGDISFFCREIIVLDAYSVVIEAR
jgi:hypothetical protein